MTTTSPDVSSALTATLVSQGVTAVFGNPGTTELPLVGAIGRTPGLSYYLCLHENVATGMAAGYAIATGKAGVSLLHVAPGIACGLGNIYNAFRNRTPLVVLSGQQDRRHQLLNPVLYGDLVNLMRPVTKWAWETQTAEEVPVAVGRAIREALSPAQAPTFVSIPLDLQTAVLPEGLPEPGALSVPALGTASASAIEAAVAMLHAASSPAIIAGDVVGAGRAVDELRALANGLAAAVYWEPVSTYANYPTSDPMSQGIMFPNAKNFEEVFARHDVVLACGLGLRAPAVYGGTSWSTAGHRVIVLTDDSAQGPGVDVDLTLLGDVAATLSALAAVSERNRTPALAETIAERHGTLVEKHRAARERVLASAAKRALDVPINTAALMTALYEKLPDNATIVDESLSNSAWVQMAGQFTDELGYLGGTKGGGIGFGLPEAVGAAIGRPDRAVVAIIGDGSSLHSIQALWTAARYQVPIVVCVLNNASYRILKGGMMTVAGVGAEEVEKVPGMNITNPEVDFVGLGRSFGVDGVRVDTVESAVAAVLDAVASREPRLVDIQVDRSIRKIFS
ncbi:thiamine pyrophosphate-binding protein [Frankia sp. CNm7]|uniref:Thiamine pyrophosphate-binding protein n=1 Tax=Frankia nepalensis TaxID=1836974 RepID=A0A937UUC0_9ACTN|nr:thiamine pyrophosphate-binding protein [Frankia nepalensis]MBL7499162.1 thiamine pyrophosphate-binding protein [Frankia nepalensis]MBL7511020.1 thiamine pyrophosphate-binding protein [Frankia nepalensis]MBL7520512.1 thiamine pyrophosphate-binding protein [Frankia nepalensis]MBL7632100.1 thiamine pyrophosphate-binding protein [Frankia nepalensis]